MGHRDVEKKAANPVLVELKVTLFLPLYTKNHQCSIGVMMEHSGNFQSLSSERDLQYDSHVAAETKSSSNTVFFHQRLRYPPSQMICVEICIGLALSFGLRVQV